MYLLGLQPMPVTARVIVFPVQIAVSIVAMAFRLFFTFTVK